MPQIYFDKKTNAIIESLKQANPSFNLSMFVREKLELEQFGSSESAEKLFWNKIEELNKLQEINKSNLEYWKLKLEEYKENQKRIAEEVIKRKEEEKEKENDKGYRETMANAIKEYFEKYGINTYLEGVKSGDWKSTIEFYEKVIKGGNKE